MLIFNISAIVYETLYKNVYKLCDIEYSVEMMLHGVNEKDGITYSVFARAEYANNDDYASHIVFDDGRKFELDRPGNIRFKRKRIIFG